MKPDTRAITLGLQPTTERLLARQRQKMGVPDHQKFHAFGRFGSDPDLKQFPELVDRAYRGSINFMSIKFGRMFGGVIFPYPNHFTIVHWLVK